MEIIIIFSLLFSVSILGVAIFSGLDLKKVSSWLFGLSGFLCGLIIGIVSQAGLISGLQLGSIFAITIIFSGAIMRMHKQRYK